METTLLNPRPSVSAASCCALSPPGPRPLYTLIRPPSRRRRFHWSRLRTFSLCRSLPIFNPQCKLPSLCEHRVSAMGGRNLSGSRTTGTLFGYRKGRISLAIQQDSGCLPNLIIELAIPAHVLMKDMSTGMVRIALECEKSAEQRPGRLLDEPLWTVFFNGKKSGYGLRREASPDDLALMEVLKAVSVGAGVLPGRSESEGPDGEMTYMRADFEHVVGSRDSETLYMFGPEGNNGPDLTIFFVRL